MAKIAEENHKNQGGGALKRANVSLPRKKRKEIKEREGKTFIGEQLVR